MIFWAKSGHISPTECLEGCAVASNQVSCLKVKVKVDTFVNCMSRSYIFFHCPIHFIFTQSAFGVRVCSDYKQTLYAADISEIQFRPQFLSSWLMQSWLDFTICKGCRVNHVSTYKAKIMADLFKILVPWLYVLPFSLYL